MGDQLVAHERAERFLVGRGVDIVPFFEVEKVRTVRGTQAHHQVFALPPEVRDLLLVLRDALTADISPDIPGKREPAAIQEGMGARSQSEIVGKIPVFEIMPGTKTRFCEI